MFFCFKQKTAYEMRISDWSSDVCSSDLYRWSMVWAMLIASLLVGGQRRPKGHHRSARQQVVNLGLRNTSSRFVGNPTFKGECAIEEVEIGRASCRERVCQYV